MVRLDGPGQWKVIDANGDRAATLPSRDRAMEWADNQYTP